MLWEFNEKRLITGGGWARGRGPFRPGFFAEMWIELVVTANGWKFGAGGWEESRWSMKHTSGDTKPPVYCEIRLWG